MLPGPRDLSKHSRGMNKYRRRKNAERQNPGCFSSWRGSCKQKSEEKRRPEPVIKM